MDAPFDRFGSMQDSALTPKDAQCRFAGCGWVPHEDSIPRGYNLLQLSVSADNSIQSWFPDFGGIPTGLPARCFLQETFEKI
jgi:hypothetical protein